MAFDPISDYPLGTRRPDLVTTPGGVPLGDVTLDAIRAGSSGRRDPRDPRDVAPAGRGRSRGGAHAARRQLRAGRRARAVPDELLLDVYTALRPRPRDSSRARRVGRPARDATTRRGPQPSSAKLPRRTRSGGSSPMASRRFSSRATRDLHLEQLVSPLAGARARRRERAERPGAGARRRGRRRHAAWTDVRLPSSTSSTASSSRTGSTSMLPPTRWRSTISTSRAGSST